MAGVLKGIGRGYNSMAPYTPTEGGAPKPTLYPTMCVCALVCGSSARCSPGLPVVPWGAPTTFTWLQVPWESLPSVEGHVASTCNQNTQSICCQTRHFKYKQH